MQKLSLVSIILMFIMQSCRMYSNESLIEHFTEELEVYRVRYEEIVEIVNATKTVNKGYVIWYVSNNTQHLRLDAIEQRDSTFVKDFEVTQSMRFFWGERDITTVFVEVKKSIDFSYLGIYNKNGNKVYLRYVFEGFEKQKEYYRNQRYKICKKGEIPKDYSNWIYPLDENWVILSPKKSFP